MAEADWTLLTGGLGGASLDKGVTYGIARPNGGGNFLYGFNSLDTAEGVAGLFVNLANFAPMAKGGSIKMAIKRGISGGKTNFSPFMFICAGGNAVTDNAYMLGLSDDDPYRIVCKKGPMSAGLGAYTGEKILRYSDETFNWDTWHHLRIDVVVNLTGDVLLQFFQNDLDSNPVTGPIWTAIPGMSEFIDDALGVNSGSAPYTSGYVGFGFYKNDVTRRGYFDHAVVLRQV